MSATACCVLPLLAISADLDPSRLAKVTVKEPGEWRSLAVGELVGSQEIGTGPSTYWKTTPELLRKFTMEFYFLTPDATKKLANDYGQLDLEATSTGRVWLIVPARPDNGPFIAVLETHGWKVLARDAQAELGYDAFGKNTAVQTWALIERFCAEGEKLSVRADTYQSPIILRQRGPHLKAARSTNGRFSIHVSASVGLYAVQGSTDLQTWTDELDVAVPSIEWQPIATAGIGAKPKFYRLLFVSSVGGL